MIDATKITNYNLTHCELELHVLFWVFAAGHNGVTTARGIDTFLNKVKLHISPAEYSSPFAMINHLALDNSWDGVTVLLGRSGLGCWKIKSRTVRELVESNLDLHTCTVEQLEGIYGIGPKTARCFVLHTREGARVAGLDTHLLKFLKDEGYDVPKSTPPSRKKYREIENLFLSLCDARKRVPAEYDLAIWNQYRSK